MQTGLVKLAHRVGDAVRTLRGRPPQGRVYTHSANLDSGRSYLTKGIMFPTLFSILSASDGGDITSALNLFDEMERLDPRLHAVANTRRLALTGLDWEVASAADVKPDLTDKNLADEAAAYTRERLDKLDGFDCALEHLSTAIGPNLAVAENIWDQSDIVAVEPVPHWRLTMDLRKSTDVRIITEQDLQGIPAESPKFIVHIPNCKNGSPTAVGLCRAQAMLWLIKKLAIADWATFCELFGMPVRWATYHGTATSDEKRMMIAGLKNMGTASWGLFSKAVELEHIEVQRGVQPYEALLNHCTREQTILWLGGNLPTDTTGGTGTHAAATVQNEVRADLRDDDIKREGRTIRDQLIRPMVALAFPGRDVPVPYFRRIKPETVDRQKEADLFGRAIQIGIDVPESWARDRLGIPKPRADGNGKPEPILVPPDVFEDGLAGEPAPKPGQYP